MQSEQLNIKLQPELSQEIELVAKVLHVPKNEWARNILAYEVKKEIVAHKQFIVREYINGNIVRKELVSILGEKEVRDIDRTLKVGKASFDDSKALAKTIK